MPKRVRLSVAGDALDRGRPEPLYLQIKNWILGEIEAGRFPLHYKLPSEDDLARSLCVSRGTLRQAIQDLIREHHLKPIHGRGTFVISQGQVEGSLTSRLLAFSEDLLLQGIPFRTEVIHQRLWRPNDRISGLLNLPRDSSVLSLKRRRFVDELPIVLTKNYVPLSHCPGIEQENFENNSLFGYLETKYHLHLSWARRTVEARSASRDVATFLDVPVNSPLLYIEQIVYLEDGQPIEYSDIWLRSDRFKLSSIISREMMRPATSPSKEPHPRRRKKREQLGML